MQEVDDVLRRLVEHLRVRQSTILVCVYTGERLPSFCCPMKRAPGPPTGGDFVRDFFTVWARAVDDNPAIHDGAVMVGRPDRTQPFRVTGWSFRLFPPANKFDEVANRGAGFNSCLAMSQVTSVDCSYIANAADAFKFVGGKATKLNFDL